MSANLDKIFTIDIVKIAAEKSHISAKLTTASGMFGCIDIENLETKGGKESESRIGTKKVSGSNSRVC